MSILTSFFNLFKYDPVADKDKTFNITQALNENWDKIDVELQRQDEETKSHKAEMESLKAQIEEPNYVTHAQDSSIKSLPVGSLDGTVDEFKAEGLTLVSDIVNGDFSDGTNEWGLISGSKSVQNNILTLTASGSLAYSYIGQDTKTNFKAGDKVFAYIKARVTNSDCTRLDLFIQHSVDYFKQIPSPIQNQWYELFGIITRNVNVTSGQLLLTQRYPDSTTADGKVIEVDGNAGVFAINMTALGIEHYTEQQMLDLVRQGYFEGMKSVENPVVEVAGKNLFDKSKALVGYEMSVAGTPIANINYFVSDFIPVNTSKQYIKNSNNRFYWFDGNRKFISRTDPTTNSVLPPSNAVEVRLEGLLSVIGTFQLEEGTVATEYEPYKSSKLIANIPLRSLPNGIKDRLYYSNRVLWLEKNIEEYVLQSGDIDNLSTNNANVDLIIIGNPLANNSPFTLGVDNKTIISGFGGEIDFNGGNLDFVENIGEHSDTSSTLYLIVPKGTYTTLVDAQADLAGTVIQYQLKEPQLINLVTEGLVSGELISAENGTCYNYSDTFHSPRVSFKVPSNTGSQISSLLQSANSQAKQIAEKVDKFQEGWIDVTLLNGWVNSFSSTALKYFKDQLGFVHLSGTIKDGITTGNTVITNLPSGYRPRANIVVSGEKSNDATVAVFIIAINGDIMIRQNNGIGTYQLNASFKAHS